MGTVTSVVVGGSITLLTVVVTALKSPTFRNLDLHRDMEDHSKLE
jgi:hypothetical protein